MMEGWSDGMGKWGNGRGRRPGAPIRNYCCCNPHPGLPPEGEGRELGMRNWGERITTADNRDRDRDRDRDRKEGSDGMMKLT